MYLHQKQWQTVCRHGIYWGIFLTVAWYQYVPKTCTIKHTDTYTCLMAPFPGLPGWAGTRIVKNNLDFTAARDSEWEWHQLGLMQVCTLFQTDNHASTPPLKCFFTGRMSFLPPNQQRQSTEGTLLCVLLRPKSQTLLWHQKFGLIPN